uniref:MSP domain-containing protein n=1 Tax=Caenorhabditis tropicalis TaxID=1561998 RepID=A0A1I7U8H7_9PELO
MESGDISSSAMYEDNEEVKDIYPIYPSKDEEVAVKLLSQRTVYVFSCKFSTKLFFTVIDAFAHFRAVLLKNEKSDIF